MSEKWNIKWRWPESNPSEKKTDRNQKQKHMTLKCSPCIRKVIRDNADQLYLESQAYSVHDTYRIIICHYCQKYGHIAKKCPDKNENKPSTCGKCAGIHETQNCNGTEKKCVNCVRKGTITNIDSYNLW